ncbi:acetolactate synthase-1/2/3 large subunit [Rhodoblastus acidophilus]|uniref:thiamine pyrophosphate-binding protein n=1 Tax=Rhodoblastus acidophilus TaxID=1074 RepID=UPI002224E451|nr:thiamine pyrophosphate-binding protein [Rhodoblastus acidophilus]MCW2283764.1 acetolactate synthase-1/2/3 large subunit [Rhodoblastus acidophilus]MCW2332887.1 acetolactate synthase-1/2/3 large subunit [Rhodoblastus acidophilus]
MIRVADYIAARLVEGGVTHAFLVTGGGAMHLNDGFTRHPGLTSVCFHHEQACAMAAEGYARVSGKLALVNVTTGPGGINALNGVFGAYTDSVGMIVVSGQVKRETLMANFDLPLRQLGDQEVDIVAMARPVVKYAVCLQNPDDVRYEVEKALWLAGNGRPGPVWIDVPVDVQGAQVDESFLRGFEPREADVPAVEQGALKGDALRAVAREVIEKLRASERPVLMPGTGVRASGAYDNFVRVIERLGVPVATAFNAHDLVADDHPCYAGRPGTVGDRAGNFAVQNSDVLLVLGCRLNIRQISYNWSAFARSAFKAMVDIDKAELAKPTLKIDAPIHADLADFFEAMLAELDAYEPSPANAAWLDWCRARVKRYPTVLPAYRESEAPVNPYVFARDLFERLESDDVVVTANATACVVTFQAARIKAGQRLFSNSGSASMGYDLPAAIGAHYATGGRIVCLAGDGSIMMNLQELQTIVGQNLPIKIFVLSNDGYHSIIQTQRAFFSDNIYGCGPTNGVTFPDFLRVAAAFGIEARRCGAHQDLDAAIRATLDGEGPQICEIMLDPKQPFSPKLSSRKLEDGRMVSAPLEDMAPFLSREELAENMIAPDPAQ